MENKNDLKIQYVPINDLKPAAYNPRTWDKVVASQLRESIDRFGLVDPFIVNSFPERANTIIGGHFRWEVAKDLGITLVPVCYINIPDLEKEKELNLRLNKNQGEFDLKLLSQYDESFLKDVGFNSDDLDKIFDTDDTPTPFDLKKELEKLDIEKIIVEKGDIYELDGSRLMCGDSTVEADVLKLMGGEKADMCFTDEPYILDYLHGKKKNGKATEGFGLKRDRRYLETESLPDNFISLWMDNVQKVAKDNFSIISYECWKNVPAMWAEMAKRWKVRNMIIWHLPNRVQGFAAKYKFFNKYDIAMVGTSGEVEFNEEDEPEELLQNEYQAALFATSGRPHWEPYEKGKKYCPTDFIEFIASDEKSSGQGIIFGTKPIEIIIPYIKVLTKRGDLIIEPFGGSGSTLIAANKMKRRCYLMEKCPTYAQVILKRWERLTGKKPVKLS
jgi:DNA modification methylase